MADEQLMQYARSLSEQEERSQALTNVYRDVGTDPDKTARAYAMGRALGEPPALTDETYDVAERRMARQLAVRQMDSPMVRGLLADKAFSRLIADSPAEWDRLGFLDKSILEPWKAGRDMRQLSNEVEDAVYSARAEDRLFGSDLFGDGKAPKIPERARRMQAARIADAQYEMASNPYNPVLERISNEDTLWGAIREAITSPVSGLAYVGAQSIAGSAEELALAAVGGVINPALGAALMGNASFQAEYGNTLVSTLQDAGIDLSDQTAVMNALGDKALLERASQRAMGRALVVASFDAISGGVASLSLKPISKAMALRRAKPSHVRNELTPERMAMVQRRMRAMPPPSSEVQAAAGRFGIRGLTPQAIAPEAENMVWQMLAGGALGGAGEALGSYAIGDEVQIGDVVLEALAETYSAPVDVVLMRAKVINDTVVERARAGKAIGNAAVYDRLAEAQDQSELAKRSPEAFASAVQSAVRGTEAETVTVNVQDIKGFMQELIAVSPAAAQQIQEAAETGGDIVLPMEEVLRIRAEAPQVAAQLREHMRFGADAMSVAEAQQFEAEFEPGLEAQVRDLAETQMRANQRRANTAQATWAALAPLRDQLVAAGRPQAEVSAAMALQATILDNISALAGMTPEEWMAAHPVRVQAAQAEGQTGFNQSAVDIRGNFNPESGVVSLFNADESTFIHEMAHYWLDALVQAAAYYIDNPRASRDTPLMQLVSDFLAWAGAPGMKEGGLPEAVRRWREGGPDVQRAAQEKFARGFEAYLMTAEAPVPKLKRMFERFVSWLKGIYVNAANLGVEMGPEVVALYDRLFVSEQAVADARARQQDMGIYDQLIREGMTEADFRRFTDIRAMAIESAESYLRAALQRDAKMLHRKREREARGIQKEYEALVQQYVDELNSLKERRAYLAFTKEGTRDAEGAVVKYKFPAEVMESVLSPMHLDWIRKRGMTAKENRGKDWVRIDPNFAAQVFGFDSPDALVEGMMTGYEMDVQTPAEEMAQADFQAKYGEAPDFRGLMRMAAERTHNDFRLRILATEAAALRRATGQATELRRAVAAFARRTIGDKPLTRRVSVNYLGKTRDQNQRLSSRRYFQAASRMGRKAADMFKKGEPISAAEAKQAELIQTALGMAVEEAAQDADRFGNRVRKALKSETIDPEYMVQINKLASSLGFSNANPFPQEKKDFGEFVKDHPDVAGVWAALPKSLIVTDDNGVEHLRAAPWPYLTVNEIRAIDDLFASVIKNGRNTRTEKIKAKNAEIADILTKGRAAASKVFEKAGRKPYKASADTGLRVQFTDFFRGFFFKHIKFSAMLRILDGNKQGYWTKTVGYRANDCATHEATLTQEYANKLNEAMKQLYKGINDHCITIGSEDFTRQNALAVLLNAGNASNRDRLRQGNGIGADTIQRIASQFTEEELLSVQKVWDAFEDLRKVAAEMIRRRDGYEPEWMQPVPFTVRSKDGRIVRLRGGYMPIRYDPKRNRAADLRQLQDALQAEKEAGYLAATTARTYTHARVRDIEEGMRLRLDFTPVFDGMSEVIHDVAWSEFVQDFNKLMRGVTVRNGAEVEKYKGLDDLLFTYFGKEGADVASEWIKNVATNGRTRPNAADEVIGSLTRGVSLAGLGFNLTSGLVQMTGLISALSRLGPAALLRGLGEFIADPRFVKRFIDERSAFMQNRSTTLIREINEVRNIVGGRPQWRVKLDRAAYGFMMLVQGVVDYTTWAGAYRQALQSGRTENEARHYADQLVKDTQGSGMVMDRSQIEASNGAARLFLAFYSYMGTAYNLGAMSFLGEADNKRKMMQIATVFMIQPVIEQILREAIQPTGDDGSGDDDEEGSDLFKAIRYCAGSTVNFSLGTVIGGREIADAASKLITGEPVYTWRGPSGARWFSDFTTLAGQLQQGEFDQQFFRAVLNMFGGPVGLPTAQTWRTWTGIDALLNEDKTDNPLVLLFGYKE